MSTPPPSSNAGQDFDRIGSVASGLCALHCAACALLPAAVASLGLGALMSHELEWVFVGFAVLCGLGALYASWRRNGKLGLPAWLLIAGILGLLTSRFLEMSEGHGHHGTHGEHGHHDEHGKDDHDDAHEKEGHHDEHASEDHHDAHGKDEAHVEAGHHGHHGGEVGFGPILGILAGLTLVGGHILCIREVRQRRHASNQDCCD